MFDIHYHLLFNLDDGPKSVDQSLKLAEASIAEGVTHVVCTPHANERFAFRPELNQERVSVLNERLGGRLTLGLGCDFHMSYDNIEDALRNPTKYAINGRQYLLVEFPQFAIVPSISERLRQFRSIGIVPIITHPERNPVLIADPNRLVEWMLSGCLVQLTAASLAGRFGRRASAMCEQLIKKHWVHFIASDAHNLDGRPPAMREASRILASRYGQDIADRLCVHNPRAAFLGETLPPQPEPLDLYDHSNRRKGFFKRSFDH